MKEKICKKCKKKLSLNNFGKEEEICYVCYSNLILKTYPKEALDEITRFH